MNVDKYQRELSVLCPTCGYGKFACENEEDNIIKCESCGRTFLKEELLKENEESIYETVQEMGKEAVTDIAKELKSMFKRTLGKNKNFIIK